MKASILAVLGGASSALAAVKGFNYASNGQNQASFEAQFKTAAALSGGNGFSGARLYTMIQDGSGAGIISAIPAAINTKTSLLLGLWASQDQNGFNNEITALKATISQYGPQVAPLITGISVGSEDLYRISPTGIANGENPGQSPSTLVSYIQQVRDAIKGTAFANIPVGHVDTWNVYTNGSNAAVISACDFLGLDEYPYYQTTDANTIDNAKTIFFNSYDAVAGVAGGKPIWITESGWPTSGKTFGQGVASVDNAEKFWQDVFCELVRRNINTWWYILADDGANPSFGVSSNGQAKYDLTCKAPSSSSSAPTSTSASGSASSGSASSGSASSGSASSGSASSGSSGTSPTTLSTSAATTGSGSNGGSNGGSPTTSGSRSATTTGAASAATTSAFRGTGEINTPNSFTGLVVAAAAFIALAL